MISAKIIADSIANDVRLTTLELMYPRFIHSEAKTHRILSLDDEEYELVLKQDVDLMDDPMLSRNASSSRAIPIEKMIKQVEENPAMSIHWGKNQPGMQAKEQFEGEEKLDLIEDWKEASIESIHFAKHFNALGVHKQIVNRLLEPFQWMKVIVTATEWDNFFKLRLHEDAEPNIQELARCMKKAMDESTPTPLVAGEWHTPYAIGETIEERRFTSVAGCARISYDNHDGSNRTLIKDIKLHNDLLEAGHMSPFEHIATPMRLSLAEDWFLEEGVTHVDKKGNYWSGNFRNWIMYRQLI